jgi:hypothetical protein
MHAGLGGGIFRFFQREGHVKKPIYRDEPVDVDLDKAKLVRDFLLPPEELKLREKLRDTVPKPTTASPVSAFVHNDGDS